MSEDILNEDLSPTQIDDDGWWHLSDGHMIDLRHVQLHLPDGKGDEQVQAVILDPSGYYEVCPLCEISLSKGIIIVMENYHYLIVRCCNKLFLYRNQKINIEAWI